MSSNAGAMSKQQLAESRRKQLRILGRIGLGATVSNSIANSIGAIGTRIREFADDNENEKT